MDVFRNNLSVQMVAQEMVQVGLDWQWFIKEFLVEFLFRIVHENITSGLI